MSKKGDRDIATPFAMTGLGDWSQFRGILRLSAPQDDAFLFLCQERRAPDLLLIAHIS